MLLLAIIATTFGQQTDPPPRLINQHHLKKSKTEKKVGWIMATSGSALLLTSFLIPKGEPFSYNSVTNVGNLFSFMDHLKQYTKTPH